MTAMLTEKVKIVSCLAPVSISTGTAVGKPLCTKNYNRVTFLVSAGVIGTSGNVITIEKGTTSSLGTAMAFNYRKASAGAAAYSELDGAVAAAESTGITIADADDGKIVAIEIEVLPDCGATYDWVGVKIAANPQGAVFSIVGILSDSRYMQTSALPTAIA